MSRRRARFSAALAALALALAGAAWPQDAAQARSQIRVVGSSTVFPFASLVAERFGRATRYRIPVIESTGTGGGMKLFCAGIGAGHPDITNASRPIKQSEYTRCRNNGITLSEVKIGFDGIVLANARSGPEFRLTRKQIFQALAARVPVDGALVQNPHRRWSDISRALPNIPIRVMGPPPTSGTRDAFVEQAMEGGAKQFPLLAKLRKRNKQAFKAAAHAIREDGVFVELGENDNLIVQKLLASEQALGIFGFGFLDQNRRRLKGARVEGVSPTFENIAQGRYKISRSLFFYVKKDHIGVIPGISGYVREFTSEGAWGGEGYLSDRGLIPLPDADRRKRRESARALTPFSM